MAAAGQIKKIAPYFKKDINFKVCAKQIIQIYNIPLAVINR